MDFPDIKGVLSHLIKKRPSPRIIPPPRTEGYAESFDGTRIFWEMHGPDPATAKTRPMVFCYGLVCSMNQWRLQLERYSKDHPCLLVDYRGHHRSDSPRDAKLFNLSAIAKDISAAMHAQKFALPAHIWGHSMGVNVALELALAEPALCQSLILCCGTPFNPFANMFRSTAIEKIVQPIVQNYPKSPQAFEIAWELMMLRTEPTELLVKAFGFNAAVSTKEDIQTYVQAVASIPPKTFFALLTEMHKGMTQAILPKIKTPALVVAGSRDFITPPSIQKRMAMAMPKATFIKIPMGSHNVQLDFGDYVCLKAEDFWRSQNLV